MSPNWTPVKLTFTVYARGNYIGLYTGSWTEPHLNTLGTFTDFEESRAFLLKSQEERKKRWAELACQIDKQFYDLNIKRKDQGRLSLNWLTFMAAVKARRAQLDEQGGTAPYTVEEFFTEFKVEEYATDFEPN